jgi:predicted Ser/Thr protein kinase
MLKNTIREQLLQDFKSPVSFSEVEPYFCDVDEATFHKQVNNFVQTFLELGNQLFRRQKDQSRSVRI